MTGEGPTAGGPWSAPRAPPRSEPPFNAPGVVLILVGVLIAGQFAHREMAPLALSSGDLEKGRFVGLLGYMFVHGGWPHVLLNAVFILAFGAPVARYFGASGRGRLAFVAFFLVCGVLAALGFVGFVALLIRFEGHGPPDWTLVGASGAASGLMGGAVRLLAGQAQGSGRLGRLTDRTVLSASLGWIVINLVLGLTGLTPGAGGAPVAWEAHIAGYFVGLLTIGLFKSLSNNRAIEP